MRKFSLFTVTFLLLAGFFLSCKKEMSYEVGAPSKGSLQSSSGNCLPKTVNGTYRVNQVLADSNSIDVTVTVTQIGSYTISTDTLNGYYFRAVGNFSSTGASSVHLKGYGKPATTGINTFTVTYDSSICTVAVTVVAAGTTTSTGSGVFALQGSGGNCMNATVAGTYSQSATLTAANTVTIQVNVTTVGTWAMASNSVTGFLFAGAGTFTTTGIQTIVLTAGGTPTTQGVQTFTVSAGNTTCTFTVTVGAGSTTGTTTSGDYFPVTQTSYWTYDGGSAGSDTLKTTVNGTDTKLGITYQRFISVYLSGPPNDTSLYRKDNNTGFYYNYIDTSAFAGTGVVFTQPGLDILILKNTLTTGAQYNTDYNVTYMGVPVTLRFLYTCANSNATIVVNGKTFTNVYQVTLKLQIGSGGVFNDASTPTDFYYAKGVGLIKVYDPSSGEQDIRYWQVF